ncbi:hypothetical protein TWF788_004089 [Orbilia oligospora]|uniref:Uncharacterized protein n=1 Tax=Orbilia oligospora TaxID=2813651 RepID=A0A7C8P8R6_ORBOL|nr:hypothetical protein TWF788_004089 [Orbilia oligospora]
MFLLGKLRFLEPVCRFTLDMVLGSQQQPDIGQATELIRPLYTTPSPGIEVQTQLKFPCLDYITEYWLHHFGEVSASELTSRVQHLETLLDELNLPFPYMPKIKGLEKPDTNDLLLWACENDNVPLFAVMFFRPIPPLPTRSRPGSGSCVTNTQKDTTRLDVGVVLSYAIERGSLDVVRYILEDPPITFRAGIRSIRGHLNIALNRKKSTALIYHHVVQKMQDIKRLEGGKNYLLGIAAGLGHPQIFNLLLKTHLAVISEGLEGAIDDPRLLVRQVVRGGNVHIFDTLFRQVGVGNWMIFQPFLSLAAGCGNREIVSYILRSTYLDHFTRKLSCPASVGSEPRKIRGQALTDEALAHFSMAEDNPILVAMTHGHRDVVELLCKEFDKDPRQSIRYEKSHLTSIFCLTAFLALRRAIIRGDIPALRLLEDMITEESLQSVACGCERYTLDFMHEAIGHKKIAPVIWLFKVQHYTRSQVEEYRENALKCGDRDIMMFLQTKWLETKN